ncbi:MAG: T9SS type A sorting domain-containing protein, partial [Cyclobacteriaceae bacterium]
PTPDEVSLPDLTGECSIAEPTAPVATDNCGESITGVADMTFPITTQGTTVITWSFEDQQGNISTQTQNANIDDTTDPIPDVATLPDLNGFCEVLAPTSPTATDNCEGAIEGQANVTFPVTAAGTTVITWTYDDGNGNMATQTQNVIIEDDAAPVPDETTLPDLNGECSLSMPAAPTATDNCDGVISGVTGASFPITESTTITWTYTDASGNSVEQTQEVIIEDVTPPVPNSSTLATLSGECVVVRPSAPKATDNCGGVITGTTTTQQLITESTTIIWTYTDPSGNFSTQDQEVVITDETAPFPDRLNLPDLVGECLVNNPGVPTALDNCDGTIQATTETEFPVTESTTITWTYSDGAGNTFSQAQDVTISGINTNVTKVGGVLTAEVTGSSYQWINCENNSPVQGATSSVFVPSNDGSYAVEISKLGCTELSDCYEVTVLGLDDSDKFHVSVYPNPVSEQLTIKNTLGKELEIKIINTFGQEFFHTTGSDQIIQIDMRSLSNGVYFMLMNDQKSEYMKRIVKSE